MHSHSRLPHRKRRDVRTQMSHNMFCKSSAACHLDLSALCIVTGNEAAVPFPCRLAIQSDISYRQFLPAWPRNQVGEKHTITLFQSGFFGCFFFLHKWETDQILKSSWFRKISGLTFLLTGFSTWISFDFCKFS